MIVYVIKRVCATLIALWGVTVLVFALMWWSPGLAGTLGEGELDLVSQEHASSQRSQTDEGILHGYLGWWERSLREETDATVWTEHEGLRMVMRCEQAGGIEVIEDSEKHWHRFERSDHPASSTWLFGDAAKLRRMSAEAKADAADFGVDAGTNCVEVRGIVGEIVDDAVKAYEFRMRPAREGVWRWRVTMGRSLATHRPVIDEIAGHAGPTLLLGTLAIIAVHLLAIPCGVVMGARRNGAMDRSLNWLLLLLWSFPVVLGGTLMMGYLTEGGLGVQWFPTGGLQNTASADLSRWETARHVFLPVTCLTYGSLAYVARQTRSAVARNVTAGFVKTARAKGCSERRILWRHLLPNGLLPMIAVSAVLLPWLLAGSVIVEKMFAINGLGMLAYRAVQNRDLDLIMALALFSAAVCVVVNLAADLLTKWADPRVRL
ncbi:MAG TPA: ABC transporter permease [Phycisphaerales bacterium]|nr:ABC transporter permease [Phycisphaerales bacterium]